jgi:hypothetical protein
LNTKHFSEFDFMHFINQSQKSLILQSKH